MPSGAYWADREVTKLLTFLNESPLVGRIVRSSCLPTVAVFRGAARSLRASGYQRTAEQCRTKFKAIKAAFFKALEQHGEHPAPALRPSFFTLFRKLWINAGRPNPEDRFTGAQRRIKRRQRRAAKRDGSPSESSGEASGASSPVQGQHHWIGEQHREPANDCVASTPEQTHPSTQDCPEEVCHPPPAMHKRSRERAAAVSSLYSIKAVVDEPQAVPADVPSRADHQRTVEAPCVASLAEAAAAVKKEPSETSPWAAPHEPAPVKVEGVPEQTTPVQRQPLFHPLAPIPGNGELYEIIKNMQTSFSTVVFALQQRIERLEATVQSHCQQRGRGALCSCGHACGLGWAGP